MKEIEDPGDNYSIEVHQYFDNDSSGTNTNCQQPNNCVSRLAGFTKWLRDNNKKGFLGEFAGAANNQCEQCVKAAISHVVENNDVYIGALWWAAGPWWNNNGVYMFYLGPVDGKDAPQYSWLGELLEGDVPDPTGSGPDTSGPDTTTDSSEPGTSGSVAAFVPIAMVFMLSLIVF